MPLDFPTFKAYAFCLFVFMRWGVSHKAVTGSKSFKKKRQGGLGQQSGNTPHFQRLLRAGSGPSRSCCSGLP